MIVSHKLFQRTKDVVENIKGTHDHESVHDHLIKTANIARLRVTGDFISSPEAKKLFTVFMDEKISGVAKRDISIITALLHDSGKILSFKEGGKQYEMNTHFPDGQTSCPGHEFLGATLVVPEILRVIPLPKEAKQVIQAVIRQHDTFMYPYFMPRKDWTVKAIIADMKAKAEGYYKEVLFNIYADLYTAELFAFAKPIVEAIFNEPYFYEERVYFLSSR